MKIFFSLLFFITTSICQAQFTIKDVFGRNLSGQHITLVDWEGYIANPAIKITLVPPSGASFPLNVSISANHSRLYFNMPATVGAQGPSKTITFNNSTPIDFYLSIFPDRADGNENYILTLNSSAGTQSFPITVIDQDVANPVIDFNILIDYSQDNPAYNFYSNTARKNTVKQAADDWAYFLNNMNFDQVNAGSQSTFIWNDDFSGGKWVKNTAAYKGFLLYTYGIHTATHRSGGGPSTSSFQTINNNATKLRRSGSYEAEVHGNYNTLGWNTSITDNTWYLGTNFGNVANDLYSIALHEMGHALSFNPGYPNFQTYKNQGFINNSEIVTYQGSNVPIDATDHFSNPQNGLIVDKISKKGIFGSEYASFVPQGRWLITKFNLLALKAIGYELKPTSPFKTVVISTTSLTSGAQGQNYSATILADGGIPAYNFIIASGNLPNGLSLNSFSGQISGTPTQTGTFTFGVRVTDYDMQTITKSFSITISSQSCSLMVTPSSLSYQSSSSSQNFSITTNSTWSISGTPNWLTLSASSGSGNRTITATAAANTTASTRTATIIITCGSTTRDISVSQAGVVSACNLTVSPTMLNYSKNSSAKKFSINTTSSWVISGVPNWLTLNRSSGSGNRNITATAATNTSSSTRSATLTVTCGSTTRTVGITQAGTSNLQNENSANNFTISVTILENSFSIGPIPANDKLNVRWQQLATSDIDLQLLDLSGKILWKKKATSYSPGSYIETLDVSTYLAGFYLLQINSQNQSLVKRLVISK